MRQLELRRSLGSESTAIPLALGGMLGAGLFVGLAPASAAAGVWLLPGVVLAALTAACCATALASQSAAYRGPGAGYACVRAELGVVPARISAATDLVGRIAVMAAVAGTVGDYLAPAYSAAVATTVVLLVVLGSTTGLRIRGASAWAWLGLTLALLIVVVVASFAIVPAAVPQSALSSTGAETGGITGAAAVMVFAFLGFERLSAPTQERDRYMWSAIRRGLVVSLTTATLVAIVTGAALLYQLGPQRLALSPVPALDVLGAADADVLRNLVAVGVAVAMLPVLHAAVESFRPTALAVVADGDLPLVLRRMGRQGTPVLLDLTAALAAVGLAWVLDPAAAIELAACCVLVHYAFVQAGARLLLVDDRSWRLQSICLGMVLVVVLAMSLPLSAMLATLGVAIVGPVLAGAISRRWY